MGIVFFGGSSAQVVAPTPSHSCQVGKLRATVQRLNNLSAALKAICKASSSFRGYQALLWDRGLCGLDNAFCGEQ